MPQITGYSEDEIRAYIDRNLDVKVDNWWFTDPTTAVRDTLFETIAAMPPEFQAMCIEGDLPNVYATPVSYMREAKKAGMNILSNGFAHQPIDKTKATENAYLQINTLKGARNTSGTYRHEFGHYLDDLVGDQHEEHYYSCGKLWQEALEKDVGKIPPIMAMYNTVVRPWVRFPLSIIPAPELKKSLLGDFEGMASIPVHVSHYPENITWTQGDQQATVSGVRGVEAFAEITRHYLTLYDKYDGDMDKVGTVIEGKYPNMWRVYKDDFLPQLQERVANEYPHRVSQAVTPPPEEKKTPYTHPTCTMTM